jgi:hypothetical protein
MYLPKHSPKVALAAALVGCCLSGAAVAMPAEQLVGSDGSLVQKAAWICGPYRCWWRPGPPWAPPPWVWHHHHHWW